MITGLVALIVLAVGLIILLADRARRRRPGPGITVTVMTLLVLGLLAILTTLPPELIDSYAFFIGAIYVAGAISLAFGPQPIAD